MRDSGRVRASTDGKATNIGVEVFASQLASQVRSERGGAAAVVTVSTAGIFSTNPGQTQSFPKFAPVQASGAVATALTPGGL